MEYYWHLLCSNCCKRDVIGDVHYCYSYGLPILLMTVVECPHFELEGGELDGFIETDTTSKD